MSHNEELKFQNFEIVVSKTNISLQVSLYYWISSFCHNWYMKHKFGPFLTQFWVNGVTTKVKTAIFWESGLRNKLLISRFYQILISIFLSPSIHDTQFWALFIQFGDSDVTKTINILEFEKLTKELDLNS